MITNLKTKLTGKTVRIIAAAALLLALVSGVLLYRSVDRYKFKEDAYFPVDSMLVEVKKGDQAVINSDQSSATLKLQSGEEYDGSENAVYFTERNALLLLCPYGLILETEAGKTPKKYRINTLTEVSKSGQNVILGLSSGPEVVNGCFLYNGQGTYIVLKDAVLTYGDTQVELPPMSYVINNYGYWIEYRNHDTGEYGYVEFEEPEDVYIDLKSAGMRILANNECINSHGVDYMLFSTISFLKEYGEK